MVLRNPVARFQQCHTDLICANVARRRKTLAFRCLVSCCRVQSVSTANFGPLIAYLVPGATALFGLAQFSPMLQMWFATSPANAPTVSGFLYLTGASLAIGMTVSAIRWATIDSLHAWTGLPMPSLNFANLGANVEAMSLLIRIHYEHYQFYANMFVATAFAYGCYRANSADFLTFRWMDGGFVALEIIFLLTSRDTLRRYYVRSGQLLGHTGPTMNRRKS